MAEETNELRNERLKGRKSARGEGNSQGFPKYCANISSRPGFSWLVYTDVYVSRYWTKVAPSVLDATRSDLSPGADFSVRKGETTRRAIFLRLQLDNV